MRSRSDIHNTTSLGDKVSDSVVIFMGSWKFIIWQTIAIIVWIAINAYLLTKPFDPYPFLTLNILFSAQAAYASPVILMAGNRAAIRDNLEATEVEATYNELAIQTKTLDLQTDILNQQTEILNAIHTLADDLHKHIVGNL